MSSFQRRDVLKIFGAGTATAGATRSFAQQASNTLDLRVTHQSGWNECFDRVFLGGDYWANPMEDWRIVDGMAECQSSAGNRNIHLLTHQLTKADQPFAVSVNVRRVESGKSDAGVGIRIGIRSELNDYRSNLFARSGINVGIVGDQLQIGRKSVPVQSDLDAGNVTLHLSGVPDDHQVRLTLTATDTNDKVLAKVTSKVAADAVQGNVALVNNFKAQVKSGQGGRYRFGDWTVAGDAFTVTPENQFGPILWTMYSLSDSRGDEGFVLKLSALTGPLGKEDSDQIQLRVRRNGEAWESMGTATLDHDAWTATFRLPNWDQKRPADYEVVYQERQKSGSPVTHRWSGKIKQNPTGRPLRMAGLTCQNDYAFPYAPVCENLMRLDPDLLYFSGDQLYEGHGGYGLIREPAEPAILNYLRKFYQHGLAFRHAMKDRPTLCIPDDHDVFQGNIWGEGGKPMDIDAGGTSSNGGYREPARMVNVVHRTNASHHPDFYDPTPVLQDISVYYGDMVYGDVSFAVVADRQWKSGPQNVDTGSGRADHLADRSVDPKTLDKPGLIFLGQRQEDFLRQWTKDWRGHAMKVLLTQTVFAGVATHHGGYDGYLVADLDCGGWPQTPRDRAIEIAREGMPLHVNGDQHLTTLVQYGVEKQRDSFWSFCTPAIAASYPRWWRPDEMGMPHQNRPQHGRENTGEYVDGLGNKAYVYAVGNPEVGTKKNRYEKAHQKGSGFGMITIDTKAKTYTLESFRFMVDATDGNPDNQFPGWPVTIHQSENAGDNRLG
ncbi:alkaline phosphatase D family protein [Crateriforma spongiae]|uniref:alkaline phosphatase D family protein n=1 Tax=Crateriforma spongiae TaxID=2724528 RepID=UPI001445CE0B|nr:alkaline phosphatase D family protein [Crateriforma spongiae]